MEGRRARLAGLTAALVLVVGLVPGPAAGQSGGQVGGTVDPSGVTIIIVRWQGQDSVHATGTGGGADPTGCDWAIVPAPLGIPPPPDIGPWRPDAYLGLLTCDGVGVRVQWVADDEVVDLGAAARRAVEEYVARVPVPRLRLHASPHPMGLVGIESWFWATGHDGRPIVDTIEALGFAVEVRIETGAVRWSFGDGAGVVGGLGEAYPARSSIGHVFQHHGTWSLEATFAWQPRYRIAGVAWEELPAIEVRTARDYRVREAQAVITG